MSKTKPGDGHKNKKRGKARPKADKAPRLDPDTALWGTHAVREAWLNPARRIHNLFVHERALQGFQPVIEDARAQGLARPAPQITDRKALDRKCRGAVHQGLIIEVDPLPEIFVQDLIVKAADSPRMTLLMLDQVTDPHNVGAILRSAAAFGAGGVIMQKKHAPALTGVLAKAASGAVEHVPVAYAINLSDALADLRDNGFMACGLAEEGEISLPDAPDGGKTILVMGSEGKGLRPKVRDHCDTLVRLPTQDPIASLNVSNAAAVSLYALVSK